MEGRWKRVAGVVVAWVAGEEDRLLVVATADRDLAPSLVAEHLLRLLRFPLQEGMWALAASAGMSASRERAWESVAVAVREDGSAAAGRSDCLGRASARAVAS